MRIHNTTAALLLTFLVAGCAGENSGNTKQPMTSGTQQAPWNVTYHDGSNNGFRFWQEAENEATRFEYSPITPETSSSGIYSGGEPRQGPMNNEHVDELWRWIEQLESDTSLHTASRMMRTGAFTVTTASGTRRFIIKHSPPLSEFNAFLAQLRD